MGKIVSKTILSKFVLFIVISWSMQTYAQVMAFNGSPKEDSNPKQKGRSQSLKSALHELETTHNISFFYQSEIVQDKYVDESDVKSKTLEEKLSFILDQNNLKYEKVKDKVYILLMKNGVNEKGFQKINTKPGSSMIEGFSTPAAFSERLLAQASSSQPIEEIAVSGVILDETAVGIPGVNVIVKGTTIGTVSDVDGKYSLKVPDSKGTLIFSYVGYITQEVAINDKSTMDIKLAPDVKSLQEVVVVGYGTVKKSDVTGSLSSVSAKQIQAVPVQSISQALQGRAAGVDVSMNSFRPGESPTIRIRGNRSLKATNNPLVVLDGIPLAEGSGVNDFNPSDIESIEILKDASATAIYGSRGANGVILVTTKKGKAGKTAITYDGYVGFSKPLVKLDMFDGGEFAEMKREAYRNNNGKTYLQPFADPNADYSLFGSDPYMWESVAMGYEWEDEANRIPKMRPITEQEKEVYRQYYQQDILRYANDANKAQIYAKLVNPESITQVPVYDSKKVRTTDWPGYALQTGVKQDHQISVSGGTDKLSLILSGGYYNEQGIQKTQSYDRYNIRLGLDYKVNNSIRIGGSSNASSGLQQYGSDMYFRAVGQLPIAIPYDKDGNLIYQPGADALIFNPIFNINNVVDERRINRFMGSYYADLKLLKGLRFRMNFGPDVRQYRRGQYYGSLSTNRNRGTSQAIYDQNQRFSYVLENLLFYDKEFNNKHTLGFTLLQSIQNERYEASGITVSDLPYDSKFYNVGSTNAQGPDAFSSDLSKKRLMSWMGRANYSLMNKYLLTVTGRFDGSSVLAPGNKWDFFPSFAVAWKAHEESFLKNLSFLDELKVRAGYGKTGNSAVDAYSTQGRLNKTRYVWGNNAAWGFNPDQLINKDLRWETTKAVNAGIDFGIFNSRVTGTIDVYQQNTTDLIMDRQIPTVSGFGTIQQNIGATRNRGVEVSVTTVNIDAANTFRWSTDFIFTKNKEEIVELYGGKNDDIGNRWFIGQPVTTYFDWKPAGVWQADEADAAAEYNRIPGQGKILDVDGNKTINDLDRVIIGNNVPDWSGSVVNTLSYKGIEFSVFVYARIGQTIGSGYFRPALAGRYPEIRLDYWTPGNPTNAYPRPNSNQERIDYPQSYLYKDGSFVKVRNISLSYTLPKSLISHLRMENLKVFVTAYNPFLFTKFNALDPEFTAPALRDGRAITNVDDQLVGNNLSEKSIVVGAKIAF